MTTDIEQYFVVGCMRCKYGGTPHCKVLSWHDELQSLRQIVLETGLTEEMKWGVPVFTKNGKNIVNIYALKAAATIGFFKGALLADTHHLLLQQGTVQSGRILQFTDVQAIMEKKSLLQDYIHEAISIEESGKKVMKLDMPEPIPSELLLEFAKDLSLQEAFLKLTKGRQRGYILYFSQPKQAQTRLQRIGKYREHIYKGLGIND